MRLRSQAAKPFLPIPLSVLLTLLWVGLVRLFFLFVAAQAGGARDGELWTAVLLGERVLGRARLPTLIVAISLLLLVYLWLDYRSQPPRAMRTLVFILAAALLVYLGWAVWHAWWTRLDALTVPGEMLMTLYGGPRSSIGAA